MADEAETTHDPKLLPALQSGGGVRAIVPQDFDGAWRIAKAVVAAKMAPAGMDTAEMCTIAILHGLEVGLTPMVALQSIAVINGRPTIWGDGAIGLIQASGKLETIKEWVEGKDDGFTAICRVVRKGDPEPKIGKFSVADAKRAKLWGKTGRSGQPTPWITYPERMLKMRARAFALRDAFSDVLRGLGIAEEVGDIPSDKPAVEAPKPPTPPKPTAPTPPKATTPDAARSGQVSESVTTETRMPPVEVVDQQTGEVTELGTREEQGGSNPFDEEKVVDVEEIDETQPFDITKAIDALEADLAVAMDETTVEEIFDHHDLLAKLEGTANAAVDAAIALRLKSRALERIAKGKK